MFAVGTKVWYNDRGVGNRPAIVTEADQDIKNGLPGYCVECLDVPEDDEWERHKWGYATQVTLR